MPDWLRLAVGTLTVLRVPPPRNVDRRVAARAMIAAPAMGLVLAIPAALVVWGLPFVTAEYGEPSTLVALLTAALAIALIAYLTRALHLDGLADTADGLGSGRDADGALAVMAQSDIGPFDVVTVTLVLVLQIIGLAACIGAGRGPLSVIIALVASRAALPLACRTGRPAARETGLGAAVAGTVPRGVVAAVIVTVTGAAGLAGLHWGSLRFAMIAMAAVLVGLGASAALGRRCDRRLGGLTGDTLGACVEVAATLVIVGLALGV